MSCKADKQSGTGVQKIVQQQRSFLQRKRISAGFDSSKFLRHQSTERTDNIRTDGISALSVIEHYVEPNFELEAQYADPTLVSVVSLNSRQPPLNPSRTLLDPTPFLMKHFSDVIAFGLLSESAKPMWTPPLPSF